jgi:hypothetical protein
LLQSTVTPVTSTSTVSRHFSTKCCTRFLISQHSPGRCWVTSGRRGRLAGAHTTLPRRGCEAYLRWCSLARGPPARPPSGRRGTASPEDSSPRDREQGGQGKRCC